VQVRTCTAPAPPPTCALDGADEAKLPGRLTATAFNAEMLIGSLVP
jgi:hypothetical protein